MHAWREAKEKGELCIPLELAAWHAIAQVTVVVGLKWPKSSPILNLGSQESLGWS